MKPDLSVDYRREPSATYGEVTHFRAHIPPPFYCHKHDPEEIPMTTKKKTKKKGAPEAPKKKANGAAKKAKAPERERLERRRYTTKLPCAIAPEIVVMRADDLAKAVREREELMAANRERNAEFREKRAHVDEEISNLATAVEQHEESRDVEVVEYLVSGTGNIEVVRQDTLEVVETKAATKDDLQESIFGKIDAAKERGKRDTDPAPAHTDSALLPALFDEEIAAKDAELGQDADA
jgi:hypothetical protein